MNKKLALIMGVAILALAGCEVEHAIGDGCKEGNYECGGVSGEDLLKCRYIDNTQETRWYQLGEHERKDLCLNLSCSVCKDINNYECPDKKYFNGSACVDDDTNNNRLKDYFETSARKGEPCHYYADCDSEPSRGDGFCDSFIGYKCSTKCTSDEQCIPYTVIDGEQYKNICRPDGRCAPDVFISVWNITSESKDKTIHLYFDGVIEVDWGDGSPIQNIDSKADEKAHTYTKSGVYTIKAKGKANFANLFYGNFGNGGDGIELLSIKSFGPMGFGFQSFAYTSSTFEVSKTDIPDASMLQEMKLFFAYSKFNGSIENWDTSNTITMQSMFRSDVEEYGFNQPIGRWDTHNVSDMGYMFANAASFNQDISKWNVEKINNTEAMFKNAKSFVQDNIKDWNLKQITNSKDVADMFEGSGLASNAKVCDIVNHWITNNMIPAAFIDTFGVKCSNSSPNE